MADSRQHITGPTPGLWQNPLVQLLLIGIAGFCIYLNTITAPFLFDDYPYLVHNPVVKEFSWFSDTGRILELGINADIKHNVILRPVAYLTFALNYALHGLDVRGYHIANLLIHISNALLVYLLISLLLKTPAMAISADENDDSFMAAVLYLPLCSALLFVCHPLQTQAVTYIIQRFTSMVTLFYLGSVTLYLCARLGRTPTSRIVCYLISVFAAILAMNTKENAFTLPVVIALCEAIFFSGSFARRFAWTVPFLMTMVIIPARLMELSSLASAANADALVDTINLVNFRKVTSWQYLMTQFGVICTYLRLLLLPVGQNFDYDYQLQRYFFHAAVLLPLCLLLLIAGTGIYLLYRSKDTVPVNRRLFKLIAFGIFWFYITLAIDSSIVPIDDLIFEHRAYLPSIGIFAAVLAGIISACRMCPGRFMTAPGTAFTTFMIIILCLSATSIARNRVWGDKITFWSDVAAKSPDKSRVHKYLGVALFEQGRTAEGIEEFRRAKMLSPGNVHARIMLGKALLVQRMYADAAGELLSATRMDPNNQLAQVVLGEVHEGQGDQLAAEKAYLAALAVAPAYPIAHQRLGELYDKQGKPAAAIREYEASLRLYPDSNVRKRLAVLKQMNKNLQRP